ncbi:uncharacterized protein LOC130636166 [Hydractinia symbiolongicarpus]|uniref:uncharacterized protein LOC130636166 n=1 Tax=Hydractinia symbiolongicarpus TaxID=13093 RepID=UPI00254B03FD|nr:uncharacterized protein LOC130636166 [Hydractinia symbiolongicarpus]
MEQQQESESEIMPKLKDVRNTILLAHASNMINAEEFCLLYDLNKSKNPEFPYTCYGRFNLDTLEEDECKAEFRFQRGDVYKLVDVFQFPEDFTCYNGTVYNSVEALCIFLKRLAYPCRYSDMIHLFGRPVPQPSIINNHVLGFMYDQWEHLLQNLQQNWLSPIELEKFCDAIHRNGAPLNNCWRFVDGTVRPISRPSQHQRIVYNGHKRVHSLKFQSVVTPSGMIANLFGPVEGRRHNSGKLTDSGLLTQLNLFSFDRFRNPLCIYGDPMWFQRGSHKCTTTNME